jgi:hypothetical protein
MKTTLFLSILILFLLSCCHKEKIETNSFPYQAEVIGRNSDCGVFSIKFTSDLDKVKMIAGGSPVSGIYIAKDLPLELQQPGITIRLDIRKMQNSESGVCTTMGPSYPWLYVIKAVKE